MDKDELIRLLIDERTRAYALIDEAKVHQFHIRGRRRLMDKMIKAYQQEARPDITDGLA
jgi:hypothetical protein